VQSEAVVTPARTAQRLGVGALARYEAPFAFVASALLVWLAQFHHLRDFGLYEDDYFFIARAMGAEPSYLLERLTVFVTLPQGRPFGFFLPDLFSFIGDKLGGLTAIYLLGVLIVSFNTFLCYRLLRARTPLLPAAVGGAMFCLFPADTTKILLTHDFQLQPALTFALLSALAYVAGRRWLAYIVAAGAFLSYESGYLALFALPLLVSRWDRRTWRELLLHVGILIGVVGLAFVARFVVGEIRATQSVGGLSDIVPKLVGSVVLGPIRAVAASLYQPLRTMPFWDAETVVVALVAAGLVGALLWQAHRTTLRAPRVDVLEVGAAGLAMLVLGYALAFTHYPPNAVVGRGTSVHLGATLGMAVLAAAIAWGVLGLRARLGAAVLAAYFGVAVGYYVTIERDFMRSWQVQRAFWQDVAACCADLQDGTVVLFELESIPTTFIFTNSWADALVLDETYRFPREWSMPPRLFSVTSWRNRVENDGAGMRWWVPGATWDEHWEPFEPGNTIVVRRVDGRLVRQVGPVEVAGRQVMLKQPGQAGEWPPAQLHDLLLK
jgi:hypothetical protein